MRKSFHIAFLLGTFTVCLPAERSRADTVTLYTDATQFASNAAGVSTVGFEGLAAANSNIAYNTYSGVTLSQVKFTGFQNVYNGSTSVTNPDLYVGDAGYGSGAYSLGSGAALYGGYGYNGGTTVWTGELDADVHLIDPTAVAFQLGLAGHAAITYDVVLYTVGGLISDEQISIPAGPQGAFVGFTSNDPFKEIIIYNNRYRQYSLGQGEHIVLDNFQTGTFAPAVAVVAPLPSSAYAGMALLGGVGMLTWARRRKAG